ncbi:MAG TPA: M1 family aminopeptidase [Mycobacteriales bacterium]
MRRAAGVMLAATVAGCVAVAGCTTATAGRAQQAAPSVRSSSASSGAASPTPTPSPTPTRSPSPRPSPRPTARAAATGCPAHYLPPDPRRPRIGLRFTVAPGLASVVGTEHVVFTPDLPVRRLVFRLTANTITSFDRGTSQTVTGVRLHGRPAHFTIESDGAAPGSPGGLLDVPLGRVVPAGTPISADLTFTLRIGSASFERFGRADGVAWWGSGAPLLSWQYGVGWHREPMARFLGESATSEAAVYDVTVIAPTGATVLATGGAGPPTPAGAGLRRWHARSTTARDVAIAVGRFATRVVRIGSTRVTVAGPDPAALPALAAQVRTSVQGLAGRFGPFPYPTLAAVSLPASGGGIEYPGVVLLAGTDRQTVTHELAHQWFYGLVGDSQARDPWLDEAFATYAEELVDGRTSTADLHDPGAVGATLASWGDDESGYFTTTYLKGSAALLTARAAAGPARFDAALRCYVAAQAWRIARPGDLARGLSRLPAAVSVLRAAGALP